MRVLVLLCALLAAVPTLAQSAAVGTVAQLQGSASATRDAGNQTLLAPEAPIFSDDILETSADGKVLVQFVDGTKLTLGPNAEVVIDEFVYNPNGGTNTAALRVTAGAMRLVAGALERVGGGEAITVATPVGTIGIRGTDFFVEMEDGRHLAVALFSGYEVAVINAGGQTVLRPGEGTDIWAAAAPSQALTWGTERVNRALALVTVAPASRPFYYAQPVAPADDMRTAFMEGTFKLDARLRYEFVDQKSRPQTSNATTFRLRAGYETLAYNGFFAGVEGEITRDLAGRRSDGVRNTPALPVIPDPDSEVLNRAYVGWTMPLANGSADDGLAGTRVVIGRQRISYDNERWIGPSSFRQNDQTVDAFGAEARPFANLAIRYAYLDRINRVLGNNPNGHWASDSHLFSASTNATPYGITTAYAYLLDLAPVPRLSSATYGVRYDGLFQETEDFAVGFEAEVARQTNHARNPNSYAVTYALLRPMVRWHDIALSAGWEHLGGNGVDAVQTPLATLHRHNGWADVFLTTPPNGLRDLHVRLVSEMPDAGFIVNPKLDLRYHDFRATRGGGRYGSEFDADLNFSVLSRATLGVRFAHYDAKTFDADTTKLWLYLEFQY
jgi:hypothetical protein